MPEINSIHFCLYRVSDKWQLEFTWEAYGYKHYRDLGQFETLAEGYGVLQWKLHGTIEDLFDS